MSTELYRRHIFKFKDETEERNTMSYRVLWGSQTKFRVEAEFPEGMFAH